MSTTQPHYMTNVLLHLVSECVDCLFFLLSVLLNCVLTPLVFGIFSQCHDDHPDEILCEEELGG